MWLTDSRRAYIPLYEYKLFLILVSVGKNIYKFNNLKQCTRGCVTTPPTLSHLAQQLKIEFTAWLSL